MNFVSASSFAHGKTSNRKRLQKATYDDLRHQFGLPAGTGLQCARQVCSTYRTLWTRAKKNAEARRLTLHQTARKAGWTKQQTPPSPAISAATTRLRAGQELSLLTLAGRIHVSYLGWNRHVARLAGEGDHRWSQALV